MLVVGYVCPAQGFVRVARGLRHGPVGQGVFILALLVGALVEAVEAGSGRHVKHYFRSLPNVQARRVGAHLATLRHSLHPVLKPHAVAASGIGVFNGLAPLHVVIVGVYACRCFGRDHQLIALLAYRFLVMKQAARRYIQRQCPAPAGAQPNQ